jgi:hypothetical protein
MMHGKASSADEQLVVLSQVLAAEVNLGYEDVLNTAVERGARLRARAGQPKRLQGAYHSGLSVCGIAVRNLRHLVQLVEECTEPFLRCAPCLTLHARLLSFCMPCCTQHSHRRARHLRNSSVPLQV